MKRIGVLLVDDHMIVREGFRRLLELEPDFAILGEAEDGRQAVAMAKRLRPDVILMDIAMPQLNGLEATRQIVAGTPGARVVILSAHTDGAYVTRATDSGAVGFLLKQTSAHEVCEAIRKVLAGGTYFTPALARHQQGPRRAGSGEAVAALTPREREVLQLVAEGKGNKQTAAALGIGVKTVEKHREHLMAKLGLHDTAGITRYAISAGIIESSVQVTIL